MICGDTIVREGREWIGTPFRWQASVKGVGCDCKGLIYGVARELELPEAASLHARMADYRIVVDTKLLREGIAANFVEVDEPMAGDVLLLRLGRRVQHLGIYSGFGHMIHTYSGGPDRVVESEMGKAWGNALDSVWRWKSMAA